MPGTTPAAASHIAWLELNVGDLDRTIGFYVEGLGFRVVERTAQRASLALGAQRIELVLQPAGGGYPTPRAANDPWFQHFAIAVADMDAAFAQLSRLSPEPITRGGPQLLPPSTGSVTAYKFRDPDGHPLELSFAPGSEWTRAAALSDALFLGIDHTALAVQALEPSIAFYVGLGFRVGARVLNQGAEQVRLDGLDAAVVDIVTLFTPVPGPHIELLHYRSPPPVSPRTLAPQDIAATRTVLAPLVAEHSTGSSCLQDPDGHLLRFTAA